MVIGIQIDLWPAGHSTTQKEQALKDDNCPQNNDHITCRHQ